MEGSLPYGAIWMTDLMRSPTVKSWLRPRVLVCRLIGAVLCAASQLSIGAPTFGSFGTEDVSLRLWAGSTLDPLVDDVRHASTPGGTIQPLSSSTLPTLTPAVTSSSDDGPAPGVSVSGSYSAGGSIESGLLHGSVAAEATNTVFCRPGPNSCTQSNSRAALTLLWMDQVTFTAPAGVSSVQVTYTPFFEGSSGAGGGAYVLDSLGRPVAPTVADFYFNFGADPQGSYLHESEDGGTFADAVARTTTVAVNVPITIELQMILQTAAGQSYGPSTAFADAMNTGGLRIDLGTAGASYSSASGVVYEFAPAVTVDEPQSALLILSGLGLLPRGRRDSRRR